MKGKRDAVEGEAMTKRGRTGGEDGEEEQGGPREGGMFPPTQRGGAAKKCCRSEVPELCCCKNCTFCRAEEATQAAGWWCSSYGAETWE